MEPVYDRVRRLQGIIPHREFSLESKIQFVNTYYLSKLWYVATFISPDNKLKNFIQSTIDRFLWYPTLKNKVNRNILKNCKEQGGIGYIDLDAKIASMRTMTLIRKNNRTEPTDWQETFDKLITTCKG